MKEQSTEGLIESRPSWADVETFARQRIQTWFQRRLEEEVEEFLGRARYARRDGVDAAAGYRNGLGKPRRLTRSAGTITVQRPRVRGLAERFESRLLPWFKRRTGTVGQLLPTLYLPGLAEGDFDLALRGLLGEGAPLSASSIARLKASWQAEYDAWKTRALTDLEPVYLWVDGVYVKAGLEKDKAAMLVILAGLRDGRKVILAVESGYRESTDSWAALLRDLKARGLRPPRPGLGAAGRLLRVPESALEASANLEPGRVAVRGGTAAHGGGETAQEGGERDGGHLEDAADRRADVPAPRCARAAGRGRGRREVCQRAVREAKPSRS